MLPTNLIEARKLLLRNWPFYGAPALGAGDPVWDPTQSTASTNGIQIFMNYDWIRRMPVPHLATVLAHESIHILKADPDLMARKMWPDNTPIHNVSKLNRAMDYWINNNLIDEGFLFPTDIKPLIDPKYKGQTVRQIYDSLPDRPEDTGDGPPNGGSDGISDGSDVRAKKLTPEEIADHRIKVRQAAEIAKGQGKLPGWADQYVTEISRPKISFRDYFDNWLQDAFSKDDASYRRLNRHYLPDFYAPTIQGLAFGTLVVALDTSGSCWSESAKLLSIFNESLKQLRPCSTTLIQFDASIQGEPIHFAPGETIESRNQPIKIVGGGGTSFVPIFDWVADNTSDAIDGLIILTDLYGTFPPIPPPYPTLWVTIEASMSAPFGTTVPFSDNLSA